MISKILKKDKRKLIELFNVLDDFKKFLMRRASSPEEITFTEKMTEDDLFKNLEYYVAESAKIGRINPEVHTLYQRVHKLRLTIS